MAATHHVLGEALDGDPFLLFELRGRSKARVLAGIRAARAGNADETSGSGDAGADRTLAEAGGMPPVTLATVAAHDDDRPRGALPALEFSFEVPSTRAAVLRQLGAPGAWRSDALPAELLAPLVERAADAARRIALAESEDAAERAEPNPAAELGRPAAPRERNAPLAAPSPRRKKKTPSPGRKKKTLGARRSARRRPPRSMG